MANIINQMFISAIGAKSPKKQYQVIISKNSEIVQILGDLTFGGYSEIVAKDIQQEYTRKGFSVEIKQL